MIIKSFEKMGEMLAESITTPSKQTKSTPHLQAGIAPIVAPQTSWYIFFQIKPFKDNDRSINHWDTVCKNLIGLKHKKIIFLIKGNVSSIKLFVWIPKDFKDFFQNTFYASYPTSDLVETDAKEINTTPQEYVIAKDAQKIFSKEAFQKDGTYMDPMNTILALYSGIDIKSDLTVSFSLQFAKEKSAWDTLIKIIKWFWQSSPKAEEAAPEKKEIKPDFFLEIGLHVHSHDPYVVQTTKANLKSAFSTFVEWGSISFVKKNKMKAMPVSYGQFVNFFHIPTAANFVKWLEYTLYRKLPYPANLPIAQWFGENELTVLGKTDYRGETLQFGIKKEDKFRHMYIIGKTGTGKSTFISNLIASDMRTGNGLCLLDPHGELVDTVLEYIPKNRINDVILFDVADSDFPIGFNLLQADTEEEKNLVASGVVSTFYKLFENSWGPRLEYILRNIVLALVDYPNATLMHILRILTDKLFREEVVSNIKDPVVLKFWKWEFEKWNDKQREEAVGPITNKVGQFLSSKLVRNIFGQPRTKLNLRKAMDEGKIILVNLSKGRIGEDNANMIGSLLVTKFQIDAMSRADIPAHLRRDFYLYIDEFQNFATKSFATILSEARKYKLSLIVANQYTSQLQPEIRDAIFGNVGTIISFTLGHDDAVQMAAQFKDMTSINDLISLPKYTAYTRLMIDGISSDPFSMKTLPPATPDGSLELIDKVRKQSRQRYAMSRNQLETLMAAWSNKTFSVQEKVAEKAQMEAWGISGEEAENLQDLFVQQHMHFFTEYAIDGVDPDAMIFDTEGNNHKAIWYTKPKGLDDQANLKYKKGSSAPLQEDISLQMAVDIYQHQTITIDNTTPLTIWIGSKEDAQDQFNRMLELSGNEKKFKEIFKFCPNLKKISAQMEAKKAENEEHKNDTIETANTTKTTPIKAESTVRKHDLPKSDVAFDIDQIKIGEMYDGYVKLTYNYGMFVTVKWVEWLLHKNFIVAPDGVDWKKFYNIWDKIHVKAQEFKEINGEKKVVWSQK